MNKNYDCFLDEEERVMLRDLIQVGKWVKRGMLLALTIGFLGVTSLGIVIIVGFKIVEAMGL